MKKETKAALSKMNSHELKTDADRLLPDYIHIHTLLYTQYFTRYSLFIYKLQNYLKKLNLILESQISLIMCLKTGI